MLNFLEITQRNGEPLKQSFPRDCTSKFSLLCVLQVSKTIPVVLEATRLTLRLVAFSMLPSRNQQLRLNFGKIGMEIIP